MAFLQIEEDVVLHYDEYGTSDQYLLTCQENVAGAGCLPYLQLLVEQGFHVYAIQIRGFGESTHVFEDYGNKWWEIWAADAVRFADKMGIDKFFYAGVSHGAGIGWYIGMTYPERVRGFFGIVAGPHARGGLNTSKERARVIQAAQTQESWNQYVNDMFGGGRPTLLGTETEEEKKAVESKMEQYDIMMNTAIECSRINPQKPFMHCETEEQLIEYLHGMRVPTLLLGGMQDPISTPETLIRSGRAVPGAKTVLYEAATHGLCAEFPQEVVEDIMLFCNQRGLL